MFKLNVKVKILKRILCWIILITTLITSIFAGFNIIYIKTYVKGQSMAPTLNLGVSSGEKGDKIYINRFAKVKRDDIVVLNIKDEEEDSYIIKRLIALEGDVVNIEEDIENEQYILVVNGEIKYSRPKFDEYGNEIEYNTVISFKSYIELHKDNFNRIVKDDNGNIKGISIKKDEAYLLGDNWEVSLDSSSIGPYKYKNIIGRVDVIIKKGQNTFKQILKQIF